jgi:diguanylate cyclase (GGDEF)-like protein
MLDLNGFKPVNDRFGHAVGDQLLIEIGQRLRAGVRSTDVAARVGGREAPPVTPPATFWW